LASTISGLSLFELGLRIFESAAIRIDDLDQLFGFIVRQRMIRRRLTQDQKRHRDPAKCRTGIWV
jgi:hypothetical protein